MRHLYAGSVFEKTVGARIRELVTSRAYIWDEGKFREITAKQVLRHRALIIASVSGPKCLVDVVIVDGSDRHAATMPCERICCYCAGVGF